MCGLRPSSQHVHSLDGVIDLIPSLRKLCKVPKSVGEYSQAESWQDPTPGDAV